MSGEIGFVVEGSLSRGLVAALKRSATVENYPVGSLLAVEGKRSKFLAVVTDVAVEAEGAAPEALDESLSSEARGALTEAVRESLTTATLTLAPVAQVREGEGAGPADSVPDFMSAVRVPTEADVEEFFGPTKPPASWTVGYPKVPGGARVPIPVDIEVLTRLSFGIFGKSGTGKTYLGNILAAYIVAYDAVADAGLRLLIFDVHSEYGLRLKDQAGNEVADGVGLAFRDRFLRFTPDPLIAKERGLELFRANYGKMDEGDLAALAPALGLTEAFVSRLSELRRCLASLGIGRDLWVWALLADEYKLPSTPEGRSVEARLLEASGVSTLEELAEKVEQRVRDRLGEPFLISYKANVSKLKVLLNYPFTAEERDSTDVVVDSLLSERGRHVIISLGRFDKDVALYMTIANLVAKKLRDRVVEASLAGEAVKRIVIFLEEAHNFLGPDVYRKSPFGDVARELRKRGVVLNVIDQRPSDLDPDVVSMLWTFFCFTLTNKRDIEAAALAVGPAYTRILPALRRREVLIAGEAVRFPVVTTVREYGEALTEAKAVISGSGRSVDVSNFV